MIEGIVDYLSPVTLTLTNSLKLLKDWYGTSMDNSASDHYCPESHRF